MWPDPWAAIPESDRAQWDYAPLEGVGPLSFGMSLQEATVAMEACGCTSNVVSRVGRFGPFEQLCGRCPVPCPRRFAGLVVGRLDMR